MITYRFIRRGYGGMYDLRFACDLDVRRAAENTSDIMCVKVAQTDRVVWRRNVDVRTANATKRHPDLRLVQSAPEQESK